MTLNLEDLELENVRNLMLEEFKKDIKEERVYISRRLKENSEELYIKLMNEAINNGNVESFAEQILKNNCLKSHESRRKPSGGHSMVKVPVTANQTLAEGEFNRFYVRALCLKAITNNFQIEAYRAKEVTRPRSKSQAIIGETMAPEKLLDDLRTNIGEEPSLKMPGGPNSGISVRKKK